MMNSNLRARDPKQPPTGLQIRRTNRRQLLLFSVLTCILTVKLGYHFVRDEVAPAPELTDTARRS